VHVSRALRTCINLSQPLCRARRLDAARPLLRAAPAQGAAVAAVLCALQQQQQQQRAAGARGACAGAGGCWPPLRMAVLCSGFSSPCAEHAEVLRAQAPLRLPSLHIYGGARHADRQVRGPPAAFQAWLSARRTPPERTRQ